MANKISKPFVFCCLVITYSIVFTFTSTNMASLYIVSDLGGSLSLASYTISFFGIGNAITIPLALTFGGKFGMKPVIRFCLISFVTVTFLLIASPNYPILIILRLMQGLTSGPILVLIPSIMTQLATDEQKDDFTKSLSIVFIIVSIISACVGGIISYEFNWRWIFFIDAIVPFIFSFFFLHLLKELSFIENKKPFDFVGYIAYALSVGSISFFIILGDQLNWLRSDLLCWVLGFFCIVFPFFILQSYHHKHPIIDFSLLKKPRMILALVHVLCLFGSYYAMSFLLSTWLHQFANYTPYWINNMLGTMLVSALLIMLYIRRLKVRNSPIVLLVGLVFLLISCVLTMYFNAEVDFYRIAQSRFFAGIGLALFLPPLLYIIFHACDTDEGFDGLVLFHVCRTIGSGLGLSLFVNVWYLRDVFYNTRLGARLTIYSHRIEEFFAMTRQFNFTPQMSLGGLEKALQRQSIALALSDTFYLMAWIMFGLIALLVLFVIIRGSKPLIDPKGYELSQKK